MKNDSTNQFFSSYNWLKINYLRIHKEWFKTGILVVHKKNFNSIKKEEIVSFDLPLNEELLTFVPTISEKNDENSFTKKIFQLLEMMQHIFKTPSFKDIFFFKNTKKEVFFPAHTGNSAFYLYPWLSKNEENFKFSGFNNFIFTIRLLYSSIEGFDQNSYRTLLTRENIDFEEGQKITEIDSSFKLNAYEQMLLSEFEKITSIIDKASNEKQKNIFIYLPFYEKILPFLNFFMEDKITFEALNDFIVAIFSLKERFISQVRPIFEKHNINVTFYNSFDNILGVLNTKKNCTAIEFLNFFGLPSDHTISEVKTNNQAHTEKKLVEYCLSQLQEEKYNKNSAAVWQFFIKNYSTEDITLKMLFTIANFVFVTLISNKNQEIHDTKNYTTCWIQHLSDKHLQDEYYAKVQKMEEVPDIFNFTLLDPTFTYKFNRSHSLFDFEEFEFTNLMQDARLLDNAQKNIINKIEGKNPQFVEEAISCSEQLKFERSYSTN